MTYEHIIAEAKEAVGVITLNRPKALNALNAKLMMEVAAAVEAFEADEAIGCLVITGNEKAFAAGADIKEMKDKTFMDCYREDFLTRKWERVAICRKPVIAAVSGFALGGGCELAMMCDFIIAADNAVFGQPEISIGAIPGLGGTQRLTRAIGKAKAMDLCLTGRQMKAEEAERSGLVARVVPLGELMDETMKAAEKIARNSQPIAMIAKESVNRALEGSLAEGLIFERRMFHAIFATADQKEGMNAFAEKRKPSFGNR
ncbi:MAG: enoyl-CoA hydratase [Rhodospirillales bacterium]